MSAVPDFAQYARDLGLTQVLYPTLEAFELLGVGKSYGWARLVATGVLPIVRLPGGKLTMVKAVDIARLIHQREAETNQNPAVKRVGRRRPVDSVRAGVMEAQARALKERQSLPRPVAPRPPSVLSGVEEA